MLVTWWSTHPWCQITSSPVKMSKVSEFREWKCWYRNCALHIMTQSRRQESCHRHVVWCFYWKRRKKKLMCNLYSSNMVYFIFKEIIKRYNSPPPPLELPPPDKGWALTSMHTNTQGWRVWAPESSFLKTGFVLINKPSSWWFCSELTVHTVKPKLQHTTSTYWLGGYCLQWAHSLRVIVFTCDVQ